MRIGFFQLTNNPLAHAKVLDTVNSDNGRYICGLDREGNYLIVYFALDTYEHFNDLLVQKDLAQGPSGRRLTSHHGLMKQFCSQLRKGEFNISHSNLKNKEQFVLDLTQIIKRNHPLDVDIFLQKYLSSTKNSELFMDDRLESFEAKLEDRLKLFEAKLEARLNQLLETKKTEEEPEKKDILEINEASPFSSPKLLDYDQAEKVILGLTRKNNEAYQNIGPVLLLNEMTEVQKASMGKAYEEGIRRGIPQKFLPNEWFDLILGFCISKNTAAGRSGLLGEIRTKLKKEKLKNNDQ